jgi:hypothetical protein
MNPAIRRAALLGAAVAGLVTYARVVQPWFRRWGATDAEVAERWPADDLLAPGTGSHTRAITIDAPPAAVWPWLAQIGQDRAGFYSYTILENLVGAGIYNADELHPEWAHHETGETVWLASERRWGERGRQQLALIEPEATFVMVSPPDYARIQAGGQASGYWGFRLVARPDGTTRLLTRARGGAVGTAAFDLIHFVMEQAMMRGIKARAER